MHAAKMPDTAFQTLCGTLEAKAAATVQNHLLPGVIRQFRNYVVADANNVNSIEGVEIDTMDTNTDALLSTIIIGIRTVGIVAETEVSKKDAQSYIKVIENKYQKKSIGLLKSFILEFELVEELTTTPPLVESAPPPVVTTPPLVANLQRRRINPFAGRETSALESEVEELTE
jgi:hypothetical protein